MRLVTYLSKDNGRAIDFIEMTMRPDFHNGIKALRVKWEIDTDFTSSGTKEAEKEWLNFLENSSIEKDISSLLLDLKIPLNWKDVVHQYLVDGNCFPFNDKSAGITRNTDGLVLEVDLENSNNLILKIGPATTMEEFKNSWNIIKKYRKIQPTRKREKENFLRDFKIFLLAKDGKTITEICNAIESEFKISNLDYGNIKKIVSSFYDRLKIPKKDRLKLKT